MNQSTTLQFLKRAAQNMISRYELAFTKKKKEEDINFGP